MKKLQLLFALLCFGTVLSQETWDYLPVEISNNYHGAICPIDENVVHVVSDYGKFYKTIDGGEIWSQFDSGINEYFFDLAFDGSDNGYAVGDNGTIQKTINAGQNWISSASGTTETLLSVAVSTQNNIWAVGDNGTILNSTNGGSSWTLDNSLTSEKLNSVKFKDENIGYIAGDNGVLLYTENGGLDWEQLTIPTTDDLFAISITENSLYILNGSSGWGDEYGHYEAFLGLKTTNNVDWIQFYIEDPFGYVGSTDMYFLHDNIGFSIGSVAMLCDCCNVWIAKTINGGENWDYSLDEETNAADCHANNGYADIKFVNQEVGFALLGKNILKTPYESAGIEDFKRSNSFTLYPNPTSNGNFNLEINSTNPEELSLEIVDMTGKKIYTENNLKENNLISTPNISEGIYFVKLLKDGKMVANQKLIMGN